LIFKVKGQGHWVKFLPCDILVNTRINIIQWIFAKLGTYLVLMRVWNPIDFQGQRSRCQIFTALHPCEHSRINIFQWILTKLGTYIVLKRFWNPIDFQGHRVKLLGEGIRHALHCPCYTQFGSCWNLYYVEQIYSHNCTGSCKSNYHMITTTATPTYF
jgi:hypothetical protein